MSPFRMRKSPPVSLLIKTFNQKKYRPHTNDTLTKFERDDGAEPSDAENERVCHGSCTEQHAPRQPLSSLIIYVLQKKYKNEIKTTRYRPYAFATRN